MVKWGDVPICIVISYIIALYNSSYLKNGGIGCHLNHMKKM